MPDLIKQRRPNQTGGGTEWRVLDGPNVIAFGVAGDVDDIDALVAYQVTREYLHDASEIPNVWTKWGEEDR